MIIDTIVFDFGGVLIDWNPKHFYKDQFEDDEKMEWFLNNICTNEWNLEQDRGRTFAEGITILKEKFAGYDTLIDSFYNNWELMLKGEISETVRLLKELKKHYCILGLTNWSAETFPIALKRFDFLQLFDGIVVSGDEKMIKPDKRFFNVLLERYDLEAGQCIFIDDNLKNVEAAAEIGFHAIHFTSPENLKEQLTLLNIILNE